jgi:hypothetical protein
MWYSTHFETPRQESMNEPDEMPFVEGTDPLFQEEKASTSATPGSEYWLP